MSELIVVSFSQQNEAERVRSQLMGLQRAHLVDLEDAAVVTKDEKGVIKLRQTHRLPLAGAASGSFWGLLIGLLFAAPIVGMAVGAGAGAVAGSLSDIGVDDDFMRDVGASLLPGSSALFLLVRKATPDKVIAELQPFEGKLLRTSLNSDDEEHLREALNRASNLQTSTYR